MFEIITLEQLLKRLEQYSHKELHVHHTWAPNHAQYFGTKAANEDERALNRQKAFRNFHVDTNGWNDIAQHVTLLPDGRFVTGRDFAKIPASIEKHNTGAFMVEMIGDFDVGKDKFEGKQKEAMMGLARWFDKRGKYIRFHRENSYKTCPGSAIDKNKFMAEVRNQPAEPVKPAPTPAPAPTPVDDNAVWRVLADNKQIVALTGTNKARDYAKSLPNKFVYIENRDTLKREFIKLPESVPATVRQGDRGDLVTRLQRALFGLKFATGGTDGIFGVNTKNAVTAFQKSRDITPDGIVGPATWCELLFRVP